MPADTFLPIDKDMGRFPLEESLPWVDFLLLLTTVLLEFSEFSDWVAVLLRMAASLFSVLK